MKTEYIALIIIISVVIIIDFVTKRFKSRKQKTTDVNNDVLNHPFVGKRRSIWISILYSFLPPLFVSLSVFIIEYYFLQKKLHITYNSVLDFLSKSFDTIIYKDLDIFLFYFIISMVVSTLIFNYYGLKKALFFVSRNIKKIVVFLISIVIAKPILHYLLYPIYTKRLSGAVANSNRRGDFDRATFDTYKEVRSSIGDHIYNIKTGEFVLFTDYVILFVPSIILVLIFFWITNGKLKFNNLEAK